MTNAVAKTTVETFLEKVGGNYVAAYNQILAEENAKALELRPRSNAEKRKAAYAAAVKVLDRKYLASMNKTVRNFLPLAKANSAITATTGVLTESEVTDLMVEVLEVKRLKEIVTSRYEEIRKRVLNSITESFAEQGEEFPEHLAGYINVPSLKLKFTREGGIRRDPVLDEDKLAALVGPEVWDKVTTIEVIPAQEIHSFDPDLFLQAARSKPELLEALRSSLVPGDFGSSSFHQRAMDVQEEDSKE